MILMYDRLQRQMRKSQITCYRVDLGPHFCYDGNGGYVGSNSDVALRKSPARVMKETLAVGLGAATTIFGGAAILSRLGWAARVGAGVTGAAAASPPGQRFANLSLNERLWVWEEWLRQYRQDWFANTGNPLTPEQISNLTRSFNAGVFNFWLEKIWEVMDRSVN